MEAYQFALGFISGALVISLIWFVVVFSMASGHVRFVNLLKKKFEEILITEIRKAHIVGSANYRFKILSDITKQQLDLLGHADQPSKGALHSKNRKNIASELKSLEEKKYELFQSFLNDNLDPVITVVDETGSKKEMKVSEFLNTQKAQVPPPPPPIKPRPVAEPINRQKGVLKLIKGNNDGEDSTNNPKDPALH